MSPPNHSSTLLADAILWRVLSAKEISIAMIASTSVNILSQLYPWQSQMISIVLISCPLSFVIDTISIVCTISCPRRILVSYFSRADSASLYVRSMRDRSVLSRSERHSHAFRSQSVSIFLVSAFFPSQVMSHSSFSHILWKRRKWSSGILSSFSSSIASIPRALLLRSRHHLNMKSRFSAKSPLMSIISQIHLRLVASHRSYLSILIFPYFDVKAPRIIRENFNFSFWIFYLGYE